MKIGRRGVLGGLGIVGGVGALQAAFGFSFGRIAADEVLRVGEFKKVYDPSEGQGRKWYINDHTFVRGRDGEWHLFGITHVEPAKPMDEKFLAHATAKDLLGRWTKRDFVMQAKANFGETVVWAPHVVENDGKYWMFYCAGGKKHEEFRIHLATSGDLYHWERHPGNPMVLDGYDARDPMVMRMGSQWILYYAATSTPKGGHHTVKAVTSEDLVHWSGMREVFSDPETGTYGGPTESPFVVARGGKFNLFVCTNHGYNETAVYVSEDAFHWEPKDLLGKFPAHAAEVIQAPEGKWYVSRAGWGQGGVYLAELGWNS